MTESTPQIRLVELLEDPIYAKWFSTQPHQSWEKRAGLQGPVWRVYAQLSEGGPWGRKNFKSWKKGRKWLLKNLDRINDGALCCINQEAPPPIVKSKKSSERSYYGAVNNLIGHLWCGYCRRPTVFKLYKRHHALGNRSLIRQPRCTICGISETGIKTY